MMTGSKRLKSASRIGVLARPLTFALAICGGMGPALDGMVAAQTSSHQSGANGNASNGSPSLLDAGPSPFPDNSRQKRNEERQRRLVGDTQKLLALTAQLKEEVAASSAEAMTPEMLKQMEEIEKLAKSVKDKMRD